MTKTIEYTRPEAEVIEIQAERQLLTDSVNLSSDWTDNPDEELDF